MDINTKPYAHAVSEDFVRANNEEITNGRKAVMLDERTIIYVDKDENPERAKKRYQERVQTSAIKPFGRVISTTPSND